jgi:hypothetical protein
VRDPAEEIVRYPAKISYVSNYIRMFFARTIFGTKWVDSGAKFRAVTPFAQNSICSYRKAALNGPLFTNHGLKDHQDESDF